MEHGSGGMGLTDKVRRFAAKPSSMQLWFVPVWCGLALARVAKDVAPFPLIARYLGVSAGPGTTAAASTTQQDRAARIGRTVRMAARHTPWTSDCYPQALVAVCVLRLARLPYAVTFGLQRGEQEADMLAHCWVTCGEVIVCGGHESTMFRPVATFVSRRTAS